MKMHAKALQEFNRLPHVDDDMRRFKTTADLVFQAQIQLDLIDEGELEATPAERNQLQRFVRNWRGK
jgi:hypothetical protein